MRYRPWRILYSSSIPESFTQPGGRGSSASAAMRATTAGRAFARGSSSSSLAAGAVMRSSYAATAPQILDDLVEAQHRPAAPLLERLQVLGVLGQGQLDRFVDQLRDGPLGRRRLEPQSPMNLRIEIDGGALQGFHEIHGSALTS